MQNSQTESQRIVMLLNRLERISVDSVWAHRASGLRGSLLKILDEIQAGQRPDPNRLSNTLALAFRILTHAASERIK